MALVEINNENALCAQWSWGQLDDLPEPYATTFRKLWNAWLRKKYAGTAALRGGWKAMDRPLGAEMIASGDFAQRCPVTGIWRATSRPRPARRSKRADRTAAAS